MEVEYYWQFCLDCLHNEGREKARRIHVRNYGVNGDGCLGCFSRNKRNKVENYRAIMEAHRMKLSHEINNFMEIMK